MVEWRLPGILRSRSAVLPLARRATSSSGGRHRGRSLSDAGEEEEDGGEGGGTRDGPTPTVLLFWLGQALMVLFLAGSAWLSLRDSGFVPAAGGDGDVVGGGPPAAPHRRLLLGGSLAPTAGSSSLHVASHLRPMGFLLPSSASNSGSATGDWRYVWWAALLALAAHEYGHARAARREGVPVQRTSMHACVAV